MPVIWIVIGYILICAYFFIHLYKWTRSFQERAPAFVSVLLMVLFILWAACIPLSAVIPAGSPVLRPVKKAGNAWIGVMVYAGIILILTDLVCLVFRLIKKHPPFREKIVFLIYGAACLLLVLAVNVYGLIHAKQTVVNYETCRIEKDCGDRKTLRAAVVADLHLGYNMGCDEVLRMVDMVNEEHPDIVLLAGDIFDNELLSVDRPEETIAAFRNLKSTYGTYAVYGNHDLEEKLFCGFTIDFTAHTDGTTYDGFLRDAGITVLKDETVLIDGSFYLSGREDIFRASKLGTGRLSLSDLMKDTDPEKPFILLDHQPRFLENTASWGVDAIISAHTHDGQLFPGNLLIRLLYENSFGHKLFGSMHSFTTSGIGCWGPYERIGTDSEILIIDFEFE